MNDARLQKKEERRWLKKAGFGKEMKDMGALAVELGRARGEVSPDGQAGLKVRGSGAAKRSLTDAVKAAVRMRDEAADVLKLCQYEHAECLKAVELVGYMRARMRGDCCRVAWLVGGLCALNLAVVVVYMLLMG